MDSKKIKLMLLLSLMCISLICIETSCKKDYPKDIPDWLKVKIKNLEKQVKKEDKNFTGPPEKRRIQEMTDGKDTIYNFFTGYYVYGNKPVRELYSYQGQLFCTLEGTWGTVDCNDSLTGSKLFLMKIKRTIWVQK